MISNRRDIVRRWDYYCVLLWTVMFGSSTWLSVNSMWLQLPLLVQELPEAWNLPSFLTIIVQIGGLAALVYGLVKRLVLPANFNPAPLICVMISVCVVCHILLGFLWHYTAWISNGEHSVSLFAIFLVLSMVACTSNVLYMPYMAQFQPSLMPAYFVGMGVSSLVPSLVALVQGSGQMECILNTTTNITSPMYLVPWFSVGAYNLVMAFWAMLALVSFCALNWSLLGAQQRVGYSPKLSHGSGASSTSLEEKNELNNHSHVNPAYKKEEEGEVAVVAPAIMSTMTYVILLLVTCWVCAVMNGILPAIQSYSALPYGQTIYHLTAVFSNLANPVACFVPFFIKITRLVLVSCVGALFVTAVTAYILATAALSPQSIMVDSPFGAFLCILAWVLAIGLLAYLRTEMASGLRCAAGNSESRLFWCGALTQLGSFLGAVVMFPLINVIHVFRSAPPCK